MSVSQRLVSSVLLALSMISSLGCTPKTVVIEKPIAVSLDRCRVEVPPLPPRPKLTSCPVIARLVHPLEICLDREQSWRMAALLDALTNVYRQAAECAAEESE